MRKGEKNTVITEEGTGEEVMEITGEAGEAGETGETGEARSKGDLILSISSISVSFI